MTSCLAWAERLPDCESADRPRLVTPNGGSVWHGQSIAGFEEGQMYKHILIATDGSDLAGKALVQGLSLAKALASQVTVVTVTEPWATQVTGEAAVSEAASKAGVSCTTVHVKERYPAEGILETAKARTCDLIVMASHGRRGLTRLLLGSQAHNVVTHSTIPVLICR
jgi:nucleotide-binding universal stress UspA family protein